MKQWVLIFPICQRDQNTSYNHSHTFNLESIGQEHHTVATSPCAIYNGSKQTAYWTPLGWVMSPSPLSLRKKAHRRQAWPPPAKGLPISWSVQALRIFAPCRPHRIFQNEYSTHFPLPTSTEKRNLNIFFLKKNHYLLVITKH